MPTARNNAFTLIELLLVIAIISIMAAISVMAYRQSFQTNRVDAVSIEMQHALEAAMAFYVDTGSWPTAQPCGSSLITNTFVTNYLPNGNAVSPFGNEYCWAQTGSTNRLFWVAVQVPGNPTDSLATATRIAGRLPNAVTTSAPDQPDIPAQACTDSICYVRAEITVPGSSTNTSSGLTIAATGDCKIDQTIANTGGGNCTYNGTSAGHPLYQISFAAAACPTNAQPVLTIMPNFIVITTSGTGYGTRDMSAYGTGTCTSSINNQEICNAQVDVDVCSGGSCSPYPAQQAGASYIVVCKPPSTLENSNVAK